MTDQSDKLQELLAQLSLQSTTTDHAQAFTVEEQATIVGHIPGTLTKNLFLKDKKYGSFLVTTLATREVNVKTIAKLLNLSGANLRFGDEEALKQQLGVIRGAVSPFALLNDTEGTVKFVLDSALVGVEIINIHPLRNDKTTSIAPQALLAFLEHINHKPTIINLDADPESEIAAASAGAKEEQSSNKAAMKKETNLGLSYKKEEDFANWYTQTITLSEMIDYSDISGCYILRPWSYSIWEQIQSWFDGEIKKLGVKNTYFPLFVSQRALNTEKDHVEGFAPEVAWVTKSGESELAEPIAIRPTSETIMYPFFAKWIRSHRDLPLEINQWCNVVRWEFKDATPFLRSREFLWQEGHTAHNGYESAQERVLSILELYRKVYEELLAVPVIKGQKTEMEKFAGGHHTTTCEAYINGTGRAIQGATSHNLGLGFGKMFRIAFEDEKGGRSVPWQTSWGLTTRCIGVAVMVHGDNKGLVLPPRVAPVQVIVLPITVKNEEENKALLDFAYDIRASLNKAGVRVDIDDRNNYTAGWKYNHWEQKGVPIRIEIGPKDFAAKQCRLVRRDNGAKTDVAVEGIEMTILALLEEIQRSMFQRAKEDRDAHVEIVREWKDFVPALERRCLVLTPFCDEKEWEEKVKKLSRDEALRGSFEAATTATSVAAKTLCKPFRDQTGFTFPELEEGTKCFVSGLPATTWVLWGRSY